MRRIAVLVAGVVALMMLAAPAFAHTVVVTNPRTGEVVNERWVGGGPLPEPAQSAPPMFGPFNLPPSHAHGLANACHATMGKSAVRIVAPPYDTGCHHGMP